MNLNNIRDLVSTALSDIHYLQRGILEVQLEQLRLSSSDRFTEKPTRAVSIGESESHEITVDAEPVRYRVGKSFKQSSILMTELDFQTSNWRRAIEQLSSEESAWLHYCYGCKQNYKNDVIICQWLWLDFLIEHSRAGFKKMKAPTKKLMRKLTYYGMQQVKCEIFRDLHDSEFDGIERDEHISSLLDVSIDSWRKDYKKRWLLMKSRCIHLNNISLLNAAEKRSEIINRNWTGNSSLPVSSGYAPEAR